MFLGLLHYFTDLGDSSVTTTFSIITISFLWYYKQRKAAAGLLTAYTLSALLITLGKILLYSRCHPAMLAFYELKSPSGHSAMSVGVYGTFAVIVSSSLPRNRRHIPFLIASVLVGLIVISRVTLSYHSVGDVIIGTTTGLIAIGTAWAIFLRKLAVKCAWRIYSVVILIAVAIVHGLHFPAEAIINHVSGFFRQHARSCG